MKPQAHKSRYLPLLITGIAVILFSTAGIARMMGWGPNSTNVSGDVSALDQAVPVTRDEARAKTRCPECGVIVSMREIDRQEEGSGRGAADGVMAGTQDETRAGSTRSYEITVRLADGSRRVIDHASPANWRPGERVIVIDGANPSDR
jgi:hypothetical protein